MARTSTNGGSQSVSTEDFNARVKRLLAEKPGGSEVVKPQQPKRRFDRRPGPRQ